MKNLYFLSMFLIFVVLSFMSYSQIVLPDYDEVCAFDEIEYTVQSNYYGDDQEFHVHNGVFLVPDSLFFIPGDSTYIKMDVNTNNNNFKIRWLDNDTYGGIYLNNNQSYELDIIFVPKPEFGVGQREKTVEVGPESFEVLLSSASNVTYQAITSSNISEDDHKTKTYVGGIIGHTFIFDINGDQNGWVAIRTHNPAANNCGGIYSSWDTVTVTRKLNPPTIDGQNSICGSFQTYSIGTSDNVSETYTWNVTNGLKIYKNGQYLTTYTGSETSVAVYEPSSGSGNGYVKAKANASGYASSNEYSKKIWFGDILPLDIRVNDAMTGFPKSEFCNGDANQVEAAYIDGDPFIDEWDWLVTGAYITIENPYGDKSRATINPQSSSSFSLKLRAHNTCGWSEWANMGVSVITCGGYYMMMSPNPADTYVELSFIEVSSTEASPNKVQLNSSKEIGTNRTSDYLVQIVDKAGTIRKSINAKSKNMNINTSDLEPGTYFLHLTFDKETYKQQLIIR